MVGLDTISVNPVGSRHAKWGKKKRPAHSVGTEMTNLPPAYVLGNHRDSHRQIREWARPMQDLQSHSMCIGWYLMERRSWRCSVAGWRARGMGREVCHGEEGNVARRQSRELLDVTTVSRLEWRWVCCHGEGGRLSRLLVQPRLGGSGSEDRRGMGDLC